MIRIFEYGAIPPSEIFARENVAANVEGVVSEIIKSVRENGVYFVSQVDGDCVIQFNSQAQERYIGSVYLICYGTKMVEPTEKEKKRGKKAAPQVDKNALVLQPAQIMSNTAYEISGRSITLIAEPAG